MAFVAMHMLRVPSMRDIVRAHIVEVTKTLLAVSAGHPEEVRQYAVNRLNVSEEDADSLVEALQYSDDLFEINVADNTDLGVVMGSWGEVAAVMANMHMHILVPDDGMEFITGDRPVSVYSPGHGGFRTGILDRRVEVTFPLNRRACLLLTWGNFGRETVTRAPPDDVAGDRQGQAGSAGEPGRGAGGLALTVRDPYVFESLGIKAREAVGESELEAIHSARAFHSGNRYFAVLRCSATLLDVQIWASFKGYPFDCIRQAPAG